MALILTFFVAGIGIGLLLKKMHFKPVKSISRFTNWSIYLLLLILGLSVGINQTIITRLADIGLRALTISIFGILFSLIATGLIYYSFFRQHEE